MSSDNTPHISCASCRYQRKKCPPDCLLAPYFPGSDPDKFDIVHRIFGKSHVIKMLKDVPVEQRSDAVHSMVYEAAARVRDPVYGCWSTVHQPEKRIAELESQVAASQAEIVIQLLRRDNHVPLLYERFNDGFEHDSNSVDDTSQPNEGFMLEDPMEDPLTLWDSFGDI